MKELHRAFLKYNSPTIFFIFIVCKLSPAPPTRTLISDIFFFLFLGGIIWTLAVIGTNSTPGSAAIALLIRATTFIALLVITWLLNCRLIKKNALSCEFLKFHPSLYKKYLTGVLTALLLIITIWVITYPIYPFHIRRNPAAQVKWIESAGFYCLGNTLEELLFRGFLLTGAVKLFGKITGIAFICLLFGLFHLQGTGLNSGAVAMIITTSSMSLLLIAVIFYTKSIWPAVTLHITGNILLHLLGMDGAGNGLLLIDFSQRLVNPYGLTIIYEVVVIGFAAVLFYKSAQKEYAARNTDACSNRQTGRL